MNKLPLTNKIDFYKNGPRYVNRYQNEMIYKSVYFDTIHDTIHDYHYKGSVRREGIGIIWNYNLFEDE